MRYAARLGVLALGLMTVLGTGQVAQANVFAAHLSGPASWDIGNAGPLTLEYRLNQPATAVTVEIFRASAPATTVKTLVGTTNYGLNTVMWDGTNDLLLPADSANDYKFRVLAVDAVGQLVWTNLTPLDGGNELGSAQYYAPVGLTINQDQDSPDFGTIFVINSSETLASTNAGATAVGNGVFKLRNDMTFTGANAAASLIALPDAATGAAQTLSPWKGQINPDNSDEISISDFQDGFEDVQIVQVSSGTVNRVLDRTTTGPTTGGAFNHGNTVAAVLSGTGAGRQLFTVEEDFDAGAPHFIPPQLDILRYDIGNTLVNYTGAPLEVANGGASIGGAPGPLFSTRDIAFGASGDIYVANRRFNQNTTDLAVSRFTLSGGVINGTVWSRTNPSLTADPLILQNWLQTYAVDVDESRNRLAVARDGGTGQTVILQASDGAVIGFIPNTGGASFRDLSWDAAGNLYTANQSDEHVRMWGPPDGPNNFTTTYYDVMDVTVGVALTPPGIDAAVSRKTHNAVDHDISVVTSTATEDRQGGPTTVVVTFDKNIQQVTGTNADVVPSSGSVSSLNVNGDELTITLSGVTDASKLNILFPGIATDGSPLLVVTENLCFGALVGDTNEDSSTNVLDLVVVRNNLNQATTGANFRSDVNADGAVNVLDLVAVRNNLNTSIVGACP